MVERRSHIAKSSVGHSTKLKNSSAFGLLRIEDEESEIQYELSSIEYGDAGAYVASCSNEFGAAAFVGTILVTAPGERARGR